MTWSVIAVVVAALALTSAMAGMALYAARIAAFPGTLSVTTSERIQLYAASVALLALLGHIWLMAGQAI